VEFTLARIREPPAAIVTPPAPGHGVPSGSVLPGIVMKIVLPVISSNKSRPQHTPTAVFEQSENVNVPGSGVVHALSAHASVTRVVPVSVAGTSPNPGGGVSVEALLI
jgi:hypothetical protein